MCLVHIVCGVSFCPNREFGEYAEYDPDDLIMNCYRLADRFHQNPEVFLSLPVSAIDRHMYYLVRLIDAQHAARAAAAREDDD